MDKKGLSQSHLDENVVRIVAAQVVVLTVLALLTESKIIILFLAVDFAIRALTSKTSPLAIIAKGMVSFLKWKRKSIFAPPKKFAASLGFIFSLLIFLLFLLNFSDSPAVYQNVNNLRV